MKDLTKICFTCSNLIERKELIGLLHQIGHRVGPTTLKCRNNLYPRVAFDPDAKMFSGYSDEPWYIESLTEQQASTFLDQNNIHRNILR